MDRRTRICLWIIVLGLGNFLLYTILYLFIGGDAINGWVRAEPPGPDGVAPLHYYLGQGGHFIEVGRAVWIYSALHSISVWLTVGAVLLAMLTLAKDRIITALRPSLLRGRTVITILATVITLIVGVFTVWFTLHMIRHLYFPPVEALP